MGDSQVVVCELKDERYGLDIRRVYEIIRLQPITVLPDAPAFVDGVINLRGRIVPVVDLAVRFGLPRSSASKSSRIVVAGAGEARVGLIVDGVSEVLMVPDEAVETTPSVAASAGSSHVRGIAKLGEDLVILLEVDALCGEQEQPERASAA